MKTEEPADTDVGCILLCPRNSEAEFALSLVRKVLENIVDVVMEGRESLFECFVIFRVHDPPYRPQLSRFTLACTAYLNFPVPCTPHVNKEVDV